MKEGKYFVIFLVALVSVGICLFSTAFAQEKVIKMALKASDIRSL